MKKPMKRTVAVLLVLALSACASETPRGQFGRPMQEPTETPKDAIAAEPAQPAPPARPAPAEPAPRYAGTAQEAPAPAAPQRDVETLRLHVDGMTCPVRCPREIKEMLSKVPGIVNVAVDVPSQTVIANVMRGTNPQTLVDAIKSP